MRLPVCILSSIASLGLSLSGVYADDTAPSTLPEAKRDDSQHTGDSTGADSKASDSKEGEAGDSSGKLTVVGPASVSLAELRVRADRAFAADDFTTALPIYKDLAVRLRNDPEAVAPLLERVRVCEQMLALQNLQPQAVPNFSNRKPHEAPKPGETRRMTLAELGNFQYDALNGGNIPEDVKGLNGMTVQLRGYMIPINEGRAVTKFVLVPDLFACCFGQPPELQHTATVVCPPGKGVPYFADEILVTGKLSVEEVRESDFIVSIFTVDVTSVTPVPLD
jgi:hypothetical protein